MWNKPMLEQAVETIDVEHVHKAGSIFPENNRGQSPFVVLPQEVLDEAGRGGGGLIVQLEEDLAGTVVVRRAGNVTGGRRCRVKRHT